MPFSVTPTKLYYSTFIAPYLHFFIGAENALFGVISDKFELLSVQFSIIIKKFMQELHKLKVLYGNNLMSNISTKESKKHT